LLLTCASKIKKEQKMSRNSSFHDGDYQRFDRKLEARNQIKLKDYIEGFK